MLPISNIPCLMFHYRVLTSVNFCLNKIPQILPVNQRTDPLRETEATFRHPN